MLLLCDQHQSSEVLIMLQHQIHHRGDVSSVPKICQVLLKRQCWDAVCDIVMCVINASHKVSVVGKLVMVVINFQTMTTNFR